MKNLILVFLAGLFSAPAFAKIIEIRGAAGINFVDPYELNRFFSTQNVKQIYIFPRTALTVFFKPADRWGIGAQYDVQSIKVNSSNGSSMGSGKVSSKRLSAKAYYHVHENVFITGPLVSVGLYHQTRINGRNSAGTEYDYNKAKETSLSIGWEVGARPGSFIFGGEVGYQHHLMRSLSGPTGDATFKANLSGPYTFGFMGFTF